LRLQVALTAATDTSELLGSFEQADRAQALAVAERRLASASLAAAAAAATAGCFDLAATAAETWQVYAAMLSSCYDTEASNAAYQAACLAAVDAAASAGAGAAASWSAAVAAYASVAATQTTAASGGFEWVDGILLEAMDAGDWVLLDNANLCSPTVLDRLNPLLEPGGELLIPEAGLVGGVPRRSFPAPGFRLLLALDPRHGEVSRAMRNRGIEVFILPTHACTDEVRSAAKHATLLRYLQSFPSARLAAAGLRDSWALGSAARLCAQQSGTGGHGSLREASTALRQRAAHLRTSGLRCRWCPAFSVHLFLLLLDNAHNCETVALMVALCVFFTQAAEGLPWDQSMPPAHLDTAAVLCSTGLPGGSLPVALAAAAASLGAQLLPHGRWPTLRESAAFGRLLTHLLERGWAPTDAAATAWRQTYACSFASEADCALLSGRAAADIVAGPLVGTLVRPLTWPSPLHVKELAEASHTCLMRREAAVLEAALASAVAAACAAETGVGARAAIAAWVASSSAAAPLLSGQDMQTLLRASNTPASAASGAPHADALLHAALALFIEAATPADAALRAQFLLELAHRATPSAPIVASLQLLAAPFSELASASAAAAELSGHPMLAVLHSARLRAATARHRADTMSALPVDPDAGVTPAEAQAEEQRVSGSSDVDASDAFAFGERATSATALLACEALAAAARDACMAAAAVAAEAATAPSAVADGSGSHLAVALARAAAPSERVRRAPAHRSLDAVPHVLAAVAAVEVALVEACTSGMHAALQEQETSQLVRAARATARTVVLLRRLAQWRDRCVTLLRSHGDTPAPVEALLLAWLCLRKPLDRLCAVLVAADVGSSAAAAAAVAAARMDACWGIDVFGAPKPLLWRAAGHPSLPASSAILTYELELRALCGGAELADDPALRTALAHAICFFSWAHVGAKTGAPVLPLADAAELLLLARTKVEAAARVMREPSADKVDDAPVQSEVDAASAACDGSDADAAGAALAYPWRLCRWRAAAECAAELRTTGALASLRASTPLLTALTLAACGNQSDAAVAAFLRVSSAAALRRHGLCASGRSPLDFAPLQQAEWLAERAVDDPLAASQLADALPVASHELWFRFHAALWSPPAELRNSRAPAWAVAPGPLPLFRPSLTARLAAVADRTGSISVADRPASLLQLRLAARSMRHGVLLGAVPNASTTQAAASADSAAVCTLAVQLIRAYSGALPALGHIAALLAGITPGSAADAASALEATHAAAGLPSILSLVLVPLLSALASPAAPPGSPADEASRGASWAYLGSARLALLSAELVADPAARDAFKLEHLRTRCAQHVEPEMLVRAAAAALPGAQPCFRGRQRCRTTIASLKARITKLAFRAVPRPAPSLWPAARAEIERFASGLGCVPLHLCTRLPLLPCIGSATRASTQGRYYGGVFLRDTHLTSYSFGALHPSQFCQLCCFHQLSVSCARTILWRCIPP
jgi:hypothetical protein